MGDVPEEGRQNEKTPGEGEEIEHFPKYRNTTMRGRGEKGKDWCERPIVEEEEGVRSPSKTARGGTRGGGGGGVTNGPSKKSVNTSWG